MAASACRLDLVPLFRRAIEDAGGIHELDPLPPHLPVPHDDAFCGERVGSDLRFGGGDATDERGFANVRVACDHDGERVLHMGKFAEHVPDFVEEEEVLVNLVDHGSEPGDRPFSQDEGIVRSPRLHGNLAPHHLGVLRSPPHGTEGLFYLVEAVQDVGQFPVKRGDACQTRGTPG